MNALFQAALDVQRFVTARGWRAAIIGGLLQFEEGHQFVEPEKWLRKLFAKHP